ncbi:MAG: FAD:protein FMN transferase [Gammaproteobacteria bacterium]
MGTTYSVKVNGASAQAKREPLQRGIDAILNHINQHMSTYLVDSELSRINQSRSAGWIGVSGELYSVLEEAFRISRLTGGAFDITVGPLVNLWGFGPGKRPVAVPPEKRITRLLERVGYRQVQLQATPPAVRKGRADLYLDLSGIAKGYAVDRVAAYLQANHIMNFMVEIGGEVRANGKNTKGVSWRIGIEKPVTDRRTVQDIIRLDGMGMATSGDYRNYFELDGRRYAHTIDPQSGRPVTHRLASVTVLHRTTMTADALATGLLVLGPQEGYELALRQGLAALFIIRTKLGFEQKVTPAFRPYLIEHH